MILSKKLILISVTFLLFTPVLSQVTGEGTRLDTTFNKIIVGEALNNARDVIKSTDLPTILADGNVIDDNGILYPYSQDIELNSNAHVYYSNSNGNLLDPKLHIDMVPISGSPTYTTRVFFSKNIPISSSNVIFNTIKLFGKEYAIGSGSDYNTLILYEESNSITLKELEEQKVTISGTEYTVKVEGVSSATAGVISVNGETVSVTQGGSYKKSGLDVYISTIYYYSKEAQVSSMKLSLGSQKMTLEDGQEVLFGTSNYVDNTLVKITRNANTNEISSFKILTPAQDVNLNHIEIGKSYEDPVWKTFSLNFASTTPALDSTDSDTIVVSYSGDRTATIKFKDYYGNENTVEFAYNNVSDLTSTPTIWLMNSNQYNITIKEGDQVLYSHYLVVNKGDDTHLLQLTNVPAGQVKSTDTVRFKDVFTGTIYEKTISPTTDCTATYCRVSMQIGSQTYYVAVYNQTTKIAGYVKVTWDDVSYFSDDKGASYGVPGYITFLPGIKAKNGEYIHFVNNYIKFNNGDVVILPGSDRGYAFTVDSSVSKTFKVGQIDYNYDNKKGNIVPTALKNYLVSIMILEGKRFDNTKHAIYSGIDATGTTIYKVHVTQPTFSDTTSYILWGSNTYISSAMDAYGTLVTYNSHDQAGATIVIPKQQLYTDIFITSIPPNRVDTTTTTIYQPPQKCEVTDPGSGETRTFPVPGSSVYGNQPTIPGETNCIGGICAEACEDNRYLAYECYCEQGRNECQHRYHIDCKAEYGNDVECLTVEKDSEFSGKPIKLGYCRIRGDVNNDGEVNIVDIAIIAKAYGSYPGHLKWNPAADLDNNENINIIDVAIAAKNFGKGKLRSSGFTGKVVLISETFNIMIVLSILIVLVYLFGLFKIRTKK